MKNSGYIQFRSPFQNGITLIETQEDEYVSEIRFHLVDCSSLDLAFIKEDGNIFYENIKSFADFINQPYFSRYSLKDLRVKKIILEHAQSRYPNEDNDFIDIVVTKKGGTQ